MNMLTWNPNANSGLASLNGLTFSVTQKPVLSFAYNWLYYEPEYGNRFITLDGNRVELTDSQVAECEAFISAHIQAQQSRVLGVDANGAYLGMVDPAQAYRQVLEGPPNGDHYVFDFTTETWRYIHGVDAQGKYVGNVPVGAYTHLAIAPPQFAYERWDNAQGKWVDGRTVAELKQDKAVEINIACDMAVHAIRETYPENEVLSWPKQEAEAKALLDALDQAAATGAPAPTVSTPLLETIAAERGIDKAELARRIMEKSHAFATASGMSFGKRQRLEDNLNAIADTDPDAKAKIAAIVW